MGKSTEKQLVMNCLLAAYLETALWSIVDQNGDPFDYNYDIDDFSDFAKNKAQTDINEFLIRTLDYQQGYDIETFLHDFWLTRNRHGAGFWDGDYGDHGQLLTDIAHEFGELNIYVKDDDGKLVFE